MESHFVSRQSSTWSLLAELLPIEKMRRVILELFYFIWLPGVGKKDFFAISFFSTLIGQMHVLIHCFFCCLLLRNNV